MALKIEAAQRLQAAQVDDEMAINFLTTLGFKGLKPQSSHEDRARYTFTGWNENKVTKICGEPREQSGGGQRFPFGKQGAIVVFPEDKTVALRNSKQDQE
jgi:hypothetical protein